jgi:hypothetical protein
MYIINVREHQRVIKNGQSRETGTRRRKPKQQHNTICVGHHYAERREDMNAPTNNPT